MAVVKVCHSGLTLGTPPRKNDHEREKRGDVVGWSADSSRRNVEFLRCVRVEDLNDRGFGVTLTVRDCPVDAKEWAAMRRAFVKRMQRKGMIRLHWVTEWQRRGVPHLHGAIFFPEGVDVKSLVVSAWLDVASSCHAGARGQFVAPIQDAVGWFEYLAKHEARGHLHEQRSTMPPGWEKSGRVWGHVGDWPVDEPQRIVLSDEAAYCFRRIMKNWRIADARSKPLKVKFGSSEIYVFDKRRFVKARNFLKCSKESAARVRGVSEWLNEYWIFRILSMLSAQGHRMDEWDGKEQTSDMTEARDERRRRRLRIEELSRRCQRVSQTRRHLSQAAR